MKGVKEDFLRKVVEEGIVDTRKYRYLCEGRQDLSGDYAKLFYAVIRLPLELLDTTAVYDGWEEVAYYYYDYDDDENGILKRRNAPTGSWFVL